MRLISVAILAFALAATGCTGLLDPSPTPTTPAAVAEPSASPEPLSPVQTPKPCEEPLRQLANSSQLMADKLVSFREPLTAKSYDGWRILGLARGANATLQVYALSIPGLAACPDAAALAERLELVAASARRQIAIVLAAGVAARSGPRQAMVALFELLPEVIAISEEAKALADRSSIEIAVAIVPDGAVDPLGPLAPLPTPAATPKPPTTAGIKASFFGSGVTLETYRVSGSTPFQISQSMNERGPYSEWTDSRADGLTQAKAFYRFQTVTNTSTGSCRLSETDDPAILIRYTVTLPRWSAPSGASRATIEWWNELVLEIATHEKRHVTIYRSAQRELNATLDTATCDNFDRRLDAIWADTERRQCEFDMKEYGYALGLSLEECLAG